MLNIYTRWMINLPSVLHAGRTTKTLVLGEPKDAHSLDRSVLFKVRIWPSDNAASRQPAH